jgi:protein TonB
VVVSKVAPIYPDQAKRYGLGGKVVVNAKVTKTGSVGDVRTVTGNAILGDAAISAVKKWRYKPATLDGRPVDSNVELTFDFNPPR